MKSIYFKIIHISSVQQYRQWWIGNQPSQARVPEVIMNKWFTTFWFSIWQIQTLCGLFDTTISWPLAVNTWNSNAHKHSSQKIWQNLDGSETDLKSSQSLLTRAFVWVAASLVCTSVWGMCVMSRQCAVVGTPGSSGGSGRSWQS